MTHIIASRSRRGRPTTEPVERRLGRTRHDRDVNASNTSPRTPPRRPHARLGDAERDASLDRMLSAWDRRQPVWVFGYGSLIWRPEFDFDHKARGRVFGYHRSLCLWSRVYRGTPEKPGLVLGLEPGGSVHGVAFRIPGAIAHAHLRALWKRELLTGSYVPRWLGVRIGHRTDERVRAIGFVMDRTAPGYAGEVDRTTMLETVCSARGSYGTCADYVLSTVQSLAEHAIYDRHLAKLAEEVGAQIALPRNPPL
jgi:glutathione-specific gamma-glutamylcyclotransferase